MPPLSPPPPSPPSSPSTFGLLEGAELASRVRVAETLPNSSKPAPRRSASRPGLWPDRVESLTPRLLRAYDGYAEVDVPVLQANGSSSSYTDMGSGIEITRVCRTERELQCGLKSFVDLIYLRDSETKELVAGRMRHRPQHPPMRARARHVPRP